eukprot:TRINITY_DN3165_c0_g1_i7.p2 TRINITY_DN3165_c0_g1~~TRINITY_DN3165_c0_g1_i7.p2  ORF type:complete len:344 (+),score=55.51 TRINITY_DN3165_c0_g1_i7:45-1034(+)
MAAATAHEKQHRKCREAVRVCVRLRPLLPADGAAAWRAAGPAGVAECAEGAREAPAFTFQRVFDTGVSNEEVYKELVEPIVTRWLAGFNGTVLAYGQTASGKTYTMFGSVDEGVEGIIYLAIERMFAHFGQHSRNAERQYLLCVSFAEVYNEGVYDLLIDGGEQSPLPIRERNGTFYVEGLTESFATCAEDVLELLHTGNQHKALGSSCLHGHSSRSHTVFRFVLAQQALNNGLATVSELNLVDLAGAESMTYERGHRTEPAREAHTIPQQHTDEAAAAVPRPQRRRGRGLLRVACSGAPRVDQAHVTVWQHRKNGGERTKGGGVWTRR